MHIPDRELPSSRTDRVLIYGQYSESYCSTKLVAGASIAQFNPSIFVPIDREKASQTREVAFARANHILFPVLCMYDFVDFTEADRVLSFKKGEVLDITQCDDDNSGWWAAIRREESKVGWISKSYVQRLSKEMAEKLRRIPQIARVHEYNAEQLYNSPVDPGANRRRY